MFASIWDCGLFGCVPWLGRRANGVVEWLMMYQIFEPAPVIYVVFSWNTKSRGIFNSRFRSLLHPAT